MQLGGHERKVTSCVLAIDDKTANEDKEHSSIFLSRDDYFASQHLAIL